MKIYIIVLNILLLFNVVSASVLRQQKTEGDDGTSIADDEQTPQSRAVNSSMKEHEKSKIPIKADRPKRSIDQMVKEENNFSYDSITPRGIDEMDTLIGDNRDIYKSDEEEISLVHETNVNSTENNSNNDVQVDKSETKPIISPEIKANDEKSNTIIQKEMKYGTIEKADLNTKKTNSEDKSTNNPTKVLDHRDGNTNVFIIINSGNIEDNVPIFNYHALNKLKLSKTKENIKIKDVYMLNNMVNIALYNVISKLPKIFDNPNEGSHDLNNLYVIVNSGNILRFKSDSTEDTFTKIITLLVDDQNHKLLNIHPIMTPNKDISNTKEYIDIEKAAISTKVKRDLKLSVEDDTNFDNNDDISSSTDIDTIDLINKSNGLSDLAALLAEKFKYTIDYIINNSLVQKILNYRVEQLESVDVSKIAVDLGDYEVISRPTPVKVKIFLLIG